MRIYYFEDSDTLAIDLDERPSADTVDYNENVLFDLDKSGNLSAITIEHASRYIQVDQLATNIPSVLRDAESASSEVNSWVERVGVYRGGIAADVSGNR